MSEPSFPYESISASQLQEMLWKEKEMLVLDVRKPDQYLQSQVMLVGAHRWNYHDGLGLPVSALKAKARNAPVICYCINGTKASMEAAHRLRAIGFHAAFLAGGIMAWEAEGRTVEHRSKTS